MSTMATIMIYLIHHNQPNDHPSNNSNNRDISNKDNIANKGST